MKLITACLLALFTMLMVLDATAQGALSLGSKRQEVQHVQVVDAEPSFAPIQHVRKLLMKWQMYINKQIPKRMHALKTEGSMAVVAASMALAFLYGVVHTLGPGHGKMVVGTYLLTRDASVFRGCMLGVKVAIAHVGMAIILVVFANLAFSQMVLNPDEKMYYLKLFSFVIIILVGMSMAYMALKKIFAKDPSKIVSYCAACGTHHGTGAHQPKPAVNKLAPVSTNTANMRVDTIQLTAPVKAQPTQMAEKAQDSFLSVAIGMVPCTGSLLILLYAMANDMLWLGVSMVVLVAVGMAAMMIIIGLLCLWGRKSLVDKFLKSKNASRYARMNGIIELTGALAIISIGALFISVL